MAQSGDSSQASTARPSIASLDGKIAIVTGSSSGIGRAICIAYASAGAHVVCADMTPVPSTFETSSTPTHEYLNADFPASTSGKPRAIFAQCNVTNSSEVAAAVAAAVSTFGRLDIQVNNAGVAAGSGARTHEMSEESFDTSLAVNCKGVWLCCKYALAQMMKQDPLPNGAGDRGWSTYLVTNLR